ncbi:response regulator [Desulfobacula sp.]
MARVLVVDDEESIRLSFSTILAGIKHDVITAADIIEAKDILESNQFDVAVIDRILTSNNGMDLVNINITQPFCTTILISAYPNFESASEGFKNNLFAYLQKPIQRVNFIDTVRDAVINSKEKLKLYNHEQQLIGNQKLAIIGMFSRGIVHDFNNLLMTVNKIIDISIPSLPAESPLLENLKQVRKVSQQGENLLKLLFSYIQQKNEILEPVQIQSLIKNSLVFLRIVLPKTIIINEHIDKRDDCILAHPTQIQQAIISLGINAMHAMENKNGIIDVSVERVKYDTNLLKPLGIKKQDCIKISVKDTGCGMDEKFLKQILGPFFSKRSGLYNNNTYSPCFSAFQKL